MQAALGNERAHYKALAGVLGKAAPSGLKFTYQNGAFSSARAVGKLGMALETAFVGAYMGAVTALKSNELKGVAAQIGANESRHLSVLTNIAAGGGEVAAAGLPDGPPAAPAGGAAGP